VFLYYYPHIFLLPSTCPCLCLPSRALLFSVLAIVLTPSPMSNMPMARLHSHLCRRHAVQHSFRLMPPCSLCLCPSQSSSPTLSVIPIFSPCFSFCSAFDPASRIHGRPITSSSCFVFVFVACLSHPKTSLALRGFRVVLLLNRLARCTPALVSLLARSSPFFIGAAYQLLLALVPHFLCFSPFNSMRYVPDGLYYIRAPRTSSRPEHNYCILWTAKSPALAKVKIVRCVDLDMGLTVSPTLWNDL